MTTFSRSSNGWPSSLAVTPCVVFALFAAGMAGVEHEQFDLRPAGGDLLPEPFHGNARFGRMGRIAVHRRQVHLARRIAEAVAAEIDEHRIVRLRLLQPLRQGGQETGLQRLAAGVDGPVGHLQDALLGIAAPDAERLGESRDIVVGEAERVRPLIPFNADQDGPLPALDGGAPFQGRRLVGPRAARRPCPTQNQQHQGRPKAAPGRPWDPRARRPCHPPDVPPSDF